ncbi:MAG: hypothetical protein V1808_02950 [Candidatus Daviesbacteria bacterium]
MKIANKENYLKIVEAKIIEAKKRCINLEQARNSAPSAMESQHDTSRETLEKEVDAQNEVIKSLEKFKSVIENSGEKSKIEEGAEFTVEFSNGGLLEDVFFASFNVALPGIQIITQKSPVGSALLDKKVGEEFNYEIGTEKLSGIIKRIE